jgi:hypothetical protein
MNVHELNAAPLFSEYENLVRESTADLKSEVDWTKLQTELVQTAEWTDSAASHLIDLARNYGSFVLRNALALAVASDIVDGEMGI